MQFASDNWGPAAPEIIEAVIKANEGYAPAYSDDDLTARVVEQIRGIFEAPEAAVYLVAGGIAANVLPLACLCPPWATVYCHRNSHIQEDECGAFEFYSGGAKLTLLDGAHAKILPDCLSEALENAEQLGVHSIRKGALSITNATEYGAVYTVEEVRALCDLAEKHGIGVHMDGARFANALAALGCTPAELTWKAGVDMLSFGGTKNGLLGVEAVVMFDPEKAMEFELRRMRGGHLMSKHRFLAAQMNAYLSDGLWLRLAKQANAAAAKLSAGITRCDGGYLQHPAEANMIFAGWPRSKHRAAKDAGAQYHLWPVNQSLDGAGEEPVTARLVCDWSTTDASIERFLELIA